MNPFSQGPRKSSCSSAHVSSPEGRDGRAASTAIGFSFLVTCCYPWVEREIRVRGAKEALLFALAPKTARILGWNSCLLCLAILTAPTQPRPWSPGCFLCRINSLLSQVHNGLQRAKTWLTKRSTFLISLKPTIQPYVAATILYPLLLKLRTIQ